MSEMPQDIGKSFYWYDYETFGTDTGRDRPAQFGGFRTDRNFVRKGKELLIYCSPADDYLPNPEACVLTGITPLTCLTEGEPESLFAKRIYDEFKRPGTIVMGYNNLKFDDEISRYMFWRNLINPYDREYGEGRAKMDMFVVVRALYAFKPETINWPTKEDGKISFKLEHLTKVNGLVHEHAHDALSDAKATYLLAKTIYEKQPKFWSYCVSLSDKNNVLNLIDEQVPLLYLTNYLIHETKSLVPVFPVFREGNEVFCWDLREDPKELLALSEEEIKKRFYVNKEDIAAGIKPLPIKEVKVNRFPFIVKALPYYRETMAQMFGLSREQLIERAVYLRELDKGFFANIVQMRNDIKRERYSTNETPTDIETSLYSGGFIGEGDRFKLEQLRQMDEYGLSEKFRKMEFDYPGLDKLIMHYIARNYPEAMTQQDSEEWYNFKYQHLVGGLNKARTFEEFFEMIERLRQEHPDKEDVIDEVYEYGEQLKDDYE